LVLSLNNNNNNNNLSGIALNNIIQLRTNRELEEMSKGENIQGGSNMTGTNSDLFPHK
jgi:hypothetical protein